MTEKYTVERIEGEGTRCKFYSWGAERDGYIMPDGVGIGYAGYAQLRFEPQTISTDDAEGLRRARAAVANMQLKAQGYDSAFAIESEWTTQGDAWLKVVQGSEAGFTDFQALYVVFSEKSAQLISATIEPYNTTNPRALHLARLDQANAQFREQGPFGVPLSEPQGWLKLHDDEWVQAGYAEHEGERMLIEVRVLFRPKTPVVITVGTFNVTYALSQDPEWQPSFTKWPCYDGWYVSNLSYPSGKCGSVTNIYYDKRWRIQGDDRRHGLGKPGDFYFATREEAAIAERQLVRELTIEVMQTRPWKTLALAD